MTGKKPKILLVMHTVPLDSGFLAAKFIKLSGRFDTHLLVWDSNDSINKFIEKYHQPNNFKNKIHSGGYTTISLIRNILKLISLMIFKASIRKYVFKDAAAWTKRIKFIIYYLPVFKLNPDIIHYEFGTLAVKIKDIKELSGSKQIVSFRGYDLNYVKLDDPSYYSDVWEYVDGVHFLGNDLKNRGIKRGYKGDKLEAIIPPAIDTDIFKRNANTINYNKLLIVSTGRLTWKKGFEYGIRAVAELKKRNIPFKYIIIGGGDYLQALQFTIQELHMENEVLLAGKMNSSEIKNYLNTANVFLHPAISEGFCNAVIEAQAMGVPVICSDADGLPENIVNNVTGFVLPKWDIMAIADKLEWCYKNPDEAVKMGQAGAQRARLYFKLEDQIDAFEIFYKQVYKSVNEN